MYPQQWISTAPVVGIQSVSFVTAAVKRKRRSPCRSSSAPHFGNLLQYDSATRSCVNVYGRMYLALGLFRGMRQSHRGENKHRLYRSDANPPKKEFNRLSPYSLAGLIARDFLQLLYRGPESRRRYTDERSSSLCNRYLTTCCPAPSKRRFSLATESSRRLVDLIPTLCKTSSAD